MKRKMGLVGLMSAYTPDWEKHAYEVESENSCPKIHKTAWPGKLRARGQSLRPSHGRRYAKAPEGRLRGGKSPNRPTQMRSYYS